MLNRRSFFTALVTLPAVLCLRTKEKINMLVGCDLSLTALESCILLGDEKGFGKPLKLFISPANQFIAKEILWSEKLPWTLRYEPTIANPMFKIMDYHVTRNIPSPHWYVEFERGVIYSEAP